MRGKVYIARRKGEPDSATHAATAREQSEAWWTDCLRDGGIVIEINYEEARDGWTASKISVHLFDRRDELGRLEMGCSCHRHIRPLA